MTTIDFYTHCADPLDVAARLCVKAWRQHGSARVLTAGAPMTAEFDNLLWTAPPTSFVPHCRLKNSLAGETPIIVDHELEHEGPAEVLINLHPAPPPFFARFERLAEIIGVGDAETLAGRERWRFYRERGYMMRSHNLAEKT